MAPPVFTSKSEIVFETIENDLFGKILSCSYGHVNSKPSDFRKILLLFIPENGILYKKRKRFLSSRRIEVHMGVTIKDVAAKAGLSISTVSKAFNDYSDISSETKEYVRKVAKEIGYYPNAIARTLKTNHSFNLGFIFDENASSGLLHPFFAEVINAFKKEAESLGYDITFINRNIGTTAMTYLDHCHYRNIDGICLAGVDFTSPEIHELIYSSVPCVTIDHVFDCQPCVISRNLEDIQLLVSHGISLGHRRIAFIHGENNSSVTKHRIRGYYRCMSDHGLTVPDHFVLESKYLDTVKTRELVDTLLELPQPPTLILLPDDYSYIGAMESAANHNLTIGKDISFAGYDGSRPIQLLRPRLTTIRQNTELMGKTAAKQLISTVETPNVAGCESFYVPGELLEGESIADLRSPV